MKIVGTHLSTGMRRRGTMDTSRGMSPRDQMCIGMEQGMMRLRPLSAPTWGGTTAWCAPDMEVAWALRERHWQEEDVAQKRIILCQGAESAKPADHP